MGCLAVSAICLLFVDRFGRCLRFSHSAFDKKDIPYVVSTELPLFTEKTPKIFKIKHHISPLFVDRYGRSLRFCSLEFDNRAISDIWFHITFLREGRLISSDCRDLSLFFYNIVFRWIFFIANILY